MNLTINNIFIVITIIHKLLLISHLTLIILIIITFHHHKHRMFSREINFIVLTECAIKGVGRKMYKYVLQRFTIVNICFCQTLRQAP